ncbi:hypothetical protein P691DRAFT_254302 [Macrolepiota fuliginosa MF-IS2]|uniref:Uncharacterized protein n=1 Tax=Macrolepiota fuliginosa MF-IS2 TaxID=1400762 RepID=A0A9P6BVH9_9AGAR|nr:hypothetical protein P691DRAFT_254302 [Macrolepiota fuliginosa MF-IS2]
MPMGIKIYLRPLDSAKSAADVVLTLAWGLANSRGLDHCYNKGRARVDKQCRNLRSGERCELPVQLQHSGVFILVLALRLGFVLILAWTLTR